MDLSPKALPSPSGGAVSIPRKSGALPRRAKAAIVVRYLLNKGAEIALEDLPEDLQSILTHQMAAMRLVNQNVVEQVIDEFTSELEAVGLSFAGGIAGALEALDGKLSPQTAARLRKEAGVRQTGDPWAQLKSMPALKLKPIFEEESLEICAVVLSKLDVSIAAELLGHLPGPRARQITYAVSKTSSVTPDALDRIGLSLAAQLDAEPVSVFENGPVQRVGAILNSSTTATRDDVMTGLEEADQHFANEVRKAIFTFANIPARVAPRDIPTVLRAVDPDQLLIALAAAEKTGMEKVTEFIFANMSARLGDQMKEDMSELGSIKTSDGEEAMAAVVAVIRQLESTGELSLIQEEEEDDAE